MAISTMLTVAVVAIVGISLYIGLTMLTTIEK